MLKVRVVKYHIPSSDQCVQDPSRKLLLAVRQNSRRTQSLSINPQTHASLPAGLQVLSVSNNAASKECVRGACSPSLRKEACGEGSPGLSQEPAGGPQVHERGGC